MLPIRSGGHLLGFRPDRAYLAARDHALTVEFHGTPGVMPRLLSQAGDRLGDLAHAKVLYEDLWPGISLIYETNSKGITESTYRLTIGADVANIRLRYNVPVSLERNGTLKFKFSTGYFTESSPEAWQEINGKRVSVAVAFRESNGEIGFRVGNHDPKYPLTIDPIFRWSVAFQGSSATQIQKQLSGETMKPFFVILAIFVVSLSFAAVAQVQPMAASPGAWTDLGSLGAGSIAYAVSAKGDVVAGTSATQYGLGGQYDRGFRWAGIMQDLDANPDDNVTVRVSAISADGEVIAGLYMHYPECNPGCGFTWKDGVFNILQNVPGGWYSPTPTGLSTDGSIVVGYAPVAYQYTDRAWLWTAATGFVDLGSLPDNPTAEALAVSQDGATIVGYSTDTNLQVHAVAWTYKNGSVTIRDLGYLPGGAPWAQATSVSSNGSVIVGTAGCGGYCTAGFRWTRKTGMVAIPIPPTKTYAYGTGVSADGKTVVGYAGQNCCDWEAWRWTQAHGTEYIGDWLDAVGVDASGGYFYSAYATTANAYGVVGQLSNGDAYLALTTSNKTGKPTFSPKPGKFLGSVSVTLNHTSPAASMFYTTDGSIPTKNSTPYTGPIQVSVTTIIKAIAIVPSYPQSAVATGRYTIK